MAFVNRTERNRSEILAMPGRIFLLWLATLATGSSLAGTIDTVAGTGRRESGGDGGPASLASLVEPFHVDLDGRGRLFIADAAGHRIRRVNFETGRIDTVVGTGQAGSDGDGGPATMARINSPYAVQFDLSDNLYLVEQGDRRVRRVNTLSGVITRIAGTGERGGEGDGGPATSATFREINDAGFDGHDGLLIADVGDWRVRRVDLATGQIAPFAGTGKRSPIPPRSMIGDGGPARTATIVGARAVCGDGRGQIYICEREGNAIRKVDAGGIITTIAGTGVAGYSGDGSPAHLATLRGPKGVRCDRKGNLYIVDTENHAIRRVEIATGLITTVAGGHQGPDGDGGEATRAGLDRPHGCVIDNAGTLYIADTNNHRVRRVTVK